MSRVTNLILGAFESDESRPPRWLVEVNSFFERDAQAGLGHMDERPGAAAYGGSKFLERDVAIGAFNYLLLAEFLDHLRGVKWENPGDVQVIVCEQDDDRFRTIDVFPEAKA